VLALLNADQGTNLSLTNRCRGTQQDWATAKLGASCSDRPFQGAMELMRPGSAPILAPSNPVWSIQDGCYQHLPTSTLVSFVSRTGWETEQDRLTRNHPAAVSARRSAALARGSRNRRPEPVRRGACPSPLPSALAPSPRHHGAGEVAGAKSYQEGTRSNNIAHAHSLPPERPVRPYACAIA
jgi:hypothetical protein